MQNYLKQLQFKNLLLQIITAIVIITAILIIQLLIKLLNKIKQKKQEEKQVPQKPEIRHPPELFSTIHKTFRYQMFHASQLLGACNATNTEKRLNACDAVLSSIESLEHHTETENKFIIAPLEKKEPGSTSQWSKDHDHQENDLKSLKELVVSLRTSVDPKKLTELYQKWNSFISSYLPHMLEEETILEAKIKSLFTEQEIGKEMIFPLMSSLPPQYVLKMLPLMALSITIDELTGMLGGMKANMPSQAFSSIIGIVKSNVSPGDFKDISKRLNL